MEWDARALPRGAYNFKPTPAFSFQRRAWCERLAGKGEFDGGKGPTPWVFLEVFQAKGAVRGNGWSHLRIESGSFGGVKFTCTVTGYERELL